MKRRLTSVVLTATLLFSSLVPSVPAFAQESIGLDDAKVQMLQSEALGIKQEKGNLVLSDFLRQAGERKGSEIVTITLEIDPQTMKEKYNLLQTESALLRTQEGLENQMKYAKKSQDIVTKRIKRLGVQFEVIETMDVTLNALVIKTNFEDAKKIVSINEVRSVELDRAIPAPTVKEVKPGSGFRDDGSNEMIDVAGAAHAYQGRGQLISIIDSGFDPSHEVFQEIDKSSLKIKDSETAKKLFVEKNVDGKYFTDKFPYGYNYVDKTADIVENSTVSHGMHVAGIAAANGKKLKGVAPQAQLLAMRVFSDNINPGSTTPSIYNKAIDDSVKLGADSINMSLGATSISDSRLEQTTINALKRAQEAGIVIAVAIGNDGFLGTDELDNPSASNPDLGLSGAPAIGDLSLAVASVNNAKVKQRRILVNKPGSPYKIIFTANDKKFPEGPQALVVAGLGKAEDFQGINVKGKVALISRGEITFSEKVLNAQNNGAIAAIVYDNVADSPLLNMSLEGIDIPAFFISKEDGELLVANKHWTVEFEAEESYHENPNGYRVSDFSTWGLSTEGNLKPDISAPGGQIYSSINKNSYGLLSGTSMASPHVAGGIAIVKQYVEKTFPNLQGAEKYKFIKNLLMSSAVPLTDKKTNALVSPRVQGAGLMNLARAVRSAVVVEGTNGFSSINIKSIQGNSVIVEGTLRNYSDTDKDFVYYAVLNTDTVENGKTLLKPRLLRTFEKKTITVPAQQTKDFEVAFILTKEEIAELEKSMPNGFFLEGFVLFEAPKDQPEREQEAFSVPFVAFHGEWDEVPTVDDSIYNHLEKGTLPYYYQAAAEGSYTFTYLSSRVDGRTVALGQSAESTFEKPIYDAQKIAISPNGDGAADSAKFFGTFLRNYKDFEVRVFKEGNLNTEIYHVKHSGDGGRKNFIIQTLFGNANHNSSREHWSWDGRSLQGEMMEDGRYIFEISVKPDIKDVEAAQKLQFPLMIDTVAPRIKKSSYDQANGIFKIENLEENGSGIRSQIIVVGKEVYKPQADGTFKLEMGTDPANATIKIVDNAYNTLELPLDKAIRNDTERSIIVQPVISSGAVATDNFQWAVEDLDGNVVDPYNLAVGKYVLVISNVDSMYEIDGSSRISFEITADDYTKVIQVPFVYKNKAKVMVEVENPQNAAIKLVLLNKHNGAEFEATPSGANRYIANVPEGEYRIVLKELHKDYYALIDTQEVVVHRRGYDGKAPVITIVKKEMRTAVANLIRNGYDKKAGILFVGRDMQHTTYLAEMSAQESSKTIELPMNLTFDMYVVDMENTDYGAKKAEFTLTAGNILASIELIKGGASNPIPVNKSELLIIINKAREFKEKDFSSESWADFEIALDNAERVYRDTKVGQAEVDKATDDLKQSIDRLVPIAQAGNKALLKKKIDEAKDLLENHWDEYLSTSIGELEEALKEAEAIYNSKDPADAKKESIDYAIGILQKALNEMKRKDGKIDKRVLESLLKDAKNILDQKEFYTPESILELEKAYDFAKKVFDNEKANADDLDMATRKLTIALRKIHRKEIDKAALKEEIQISEKIDLLQYERESREAFRKALVKAKQVYANRRASQEEINEAYNDLREKRENLKLIKDDVQDQYQVPVRILNIEDDDESTGNVFLSPNASVEKTKDGKYQYTLTFNSSFIDLGMDGVYGNVTELSIINKGEVQLVERKEIGDSIIEYTFESDEKLNTQQIQFVIDFMVDFGVPQYDGRLVFDWSKAKRK